MSAVSHYKNAQPLEPTYFTDEGRPTVGWIMRNLNRERYVADALKWNIEELEEHQQLLEYALQSRSKTTWSNCVNNLNMAIAYKKEGNPEYIDYASAHFYECWDLS